jgi:ubiquinol-cytochrome c reductase cytochrome c subunit
LKSRAQHGIDDRGIVGVLFGLAAVACTVVVLTLDARPLAAQSPAADARTLYLRDCAVCHGPDGRGTASGPTLEGWGRAGVDYALTTGRMPLGSPTETPRRSKPAYDAATIASLVDYVGQLVPGGPDIPVVDVDHGDLAAGGEIFRAQCAACHQWGGEGGALLRREAPRLDLATPTQVVEAIRLGPGTMPVFGPAAISDDELDDVASYVEYLHQPNDRGGLPLWHLGPVPEGATALLAIGLLMFGLRYVGSRG